MARLCIAEERGFKYVTLLSVGAVHPVSKIDVQGGGKEVAGSIGSISGVEQYIEIHPSLSLGLQFNTSKPATHRSEQFISNATSFLDSESWTLLLSYRGQLISQGSVRPYVVAGAGVQNTHLSIEASPGSPWPDTGTKESRKIVDAWKYSLAAAVGVGIDFYYKKYPKFFQSIEVRWFYLGDNSYGVTSEGRGARLSDAKGSLHEIAILFPLGIRY